MQDRHVHDHSGNGSSCPVTVGLDSAAPAAATRRSFLRNSGLIGAGVAAAATLGPAQLAVADPLAESATAAGAGSRRRPDPASPRFTLVVMPDTQYLFDEDRLHPAPLEASFRHVLHGDPEENAVFLAHLGDVTQNGLAEEYAAATRVFDLLDQHGAGYSVLAGNHDVGSSTTDQRGRTPYLDTFNPKRFARSATFGGASPDGYNSFHVFTAGGREWLLLALDWRLSDGGFAWADGVIAQHRTLPVILTTHEIVSADDHGTAQLSDYGRTLWDRLIKGNDQIFLTLNGHYWPPGRAVLTNQAGHDVHVHITNYQDRYYGGAAMIRTYRFDLERNTIDVSTFSPWIQDLAAGQANALARQEIELSGDIDRFSVGIDFERRFAGFAPVPPRPARPAREVIVPGTVAYWRFDGRGPDGGDVGTAAVVKDQSGHGNDLSGQTVPGTPASALTWSGDHHPDQPAHGSLRFAGQGSPLRGTWLQTAAKAPINAATFASGYTFEAFLKLPSDWDPAQSAWSALLSRWGLSGEAGKHGGATDPQEPIATLSLSGGAELQWCVYPLNQTGSSTNWSHLLPLGSWWHVAVVNDGRHTRMYVDGCEVVRNPSTPAVGLTTLNHSWLLGGYGYAGVINQVFNGWVGDVRIVDRALDPSRFMNA